MRNLVSLEAGVFRKGKQGSNGVMFEITTGSKGNSSLAQAGGSHVGEKVHRIRGLNSLWQKTLMN